MAPRRADLLLHPVRLRILQETAGHELTTAELTERLADVPQSSLYRHIRALADAGVLAVVATRPVRGTVERTYTLNTEAAWLSPEEVRALTPAEHLEYFSGFIGSLLERAAAYLRTPGADPVRDRFGYQIDAVWASDEELSALNDTIRKAVGELAERGPDSDHPRRLFTTILIPDLPASTADSP